MRSYVSAHRRLRFHPKEVDVSLGWDDGQLASPVEDLRKVFAEETMSDEDRKRRVRNAAKRERKARGSR